MNIAIITAYNQRYKTLSDITYQTISRYAKKYHHTIHRFTVDHTDKPHWEKLKLIRSMFEFWHKWCLWIDADAFINNHDFDIRDLCDNDYDLIISKDFNGLNSGVMLWQNTENSRNFLARVKSLEVSTDHPDQEQHAIINLIETEPHSIRVKYVPQAILNAYDYSLYDLPNHEGHYLKTSFAIHFPGIIYPFTIRRTCEILNKHCSLKLCSTEYHEWLLATDSNWHKQKVLDEIVKKSGEIIEGDCIHEHQNINSRPTALKNKQLNLISAARNASNALEIGFNAGHSALLMLLANPDLKLTCFDDLSHKYSQKCFDYLKYNFRDRITLVAGNSTDTVPKHNSTTPSEYDLIHIDGSHVPEIAEADLANTYPRLQQFGTLIWDDVQCPKLNHIIQLNVNGGRLIEHQVYPTLLYPHRIFFKPIAIPPEGHNCQGHPMRYFNT